MEHPIKYRKIKKSDVNQLSTFIEGVFKLFVAPEFSKEGIDEFMKYIKPDALINHFEKNHFGLLASVGTIIIGTIVVRDFNHIALFFVDAPHQRMGVGRELFRRAWELCCINDGSNTQITVNSSPNSVNAYKNLKFEPTDKEQCVNGIRFVPMAMQLQKPASGWPLILHIAIKFIMLEITISPRF